MSGRASFEGMLCFSGSSTLEQASELLLQGDDSLFAALGGASLRREHLMLRFAVRATVPAALFEGTTMALARVGMLRDARGVVDSQFENDDLESRLYERRVTAPGEPRAASSWWTRTRSPEASGVVVLYAVDDESSHEEPTSPSFVVGAAPRTLLDDNLGEADPIHIAERMLNQILATAQPSEEPRAALLEALSWVQRRPESALLVRREPGAVAGEGTQLR